MREHDEHDDIDAEEFGDDSIEESLRLAATFRDGNLKDVRAAILALDTADAVVMAIRVYAQMSGPEKFSFRRLMGVDGN